MQTSISKIGLLGVLLAMVMSSAALATVTQPLNEQGITEVVVSVFVQDVEEINAANHSFIANIFYEAVWQDNKLAHPGEKRNERKLDEIWHPKLQFINQRQISETLPKTVYVSPAGEVTYLQRVRGQFTQRVDMKNFPFDEQVFSIDLAVMGSIPTEVKIFPGELSIASELSIADWLITDWQLLSERYNITSAKLGPPVASTKFMAKRNIGYYMLKVIMPLSLIVMMSWSIFWIHPENSATQIAMSVTAVLTLMTYRNMVDNLMPKLSFMTRMDVFILGSTILLFVSLLQAVYTSVLVSDGKGEAAQRLDVMCRWLFPLLFFALTVYFFSA